MKRYYVESKYDVRYFSTINDAFSAMELLAPYHQYDFDRKTAALEIERCGHYKAGEISVHEVKG